MTSKVNVIYTKPVEGFEPKTGKKLVTPAGTKASLSPEEYGRIKHAVRVVKPAKAVAKKDEGSAG